MFIFPQKEKKSRKSKQKDSSETHDTMRKKLLQV